MASSAEGTTREPCGRTRPVESVAWHGAGGARVRVRVAVHWGSLRGDIRAGVRPAAGDRLRRACPACGVPRGPQRVQHRADRTAGPAEISGPHGESSAPDRRPARYARVRRQAAAGGGYRGCSMRRYALARAIRDSRIVGMAQQVRHAAPRMRLTPVNIRLRILYQEIICSDYGGLGGYTAQLCRRSCSRTSFGSALARTMRRAQSRPPLRRPSRSPPGNTQGLSFRRGSVPRSPTAASGSWTARGPDLACARRSSPASGSTSRQRNVRISLLRQPAPLASANSAWAWASPCNRCSHA